MKRKRENESPYEREIVMALCETKGKEIGVCWFECGSNTVGLCQYLDTNTYIQTLILINMYSPTQIIISKTQEKSELTQLLKKNRNKIVFLPRSSFNENEGVTLSERLFVGSCCDLLRRDLTKRYLCAASFNALIQKVEKSAFIIQPGALYGKYIPLSNKIRIDVQTAQQLELITNNLDAKKTGSLFAVINTTLTNNGRKTLIDNILQPPCDIETILERQNCVEFFLRNSELYYRSIEFLKQLPDIDKIITSILQLNRIDSIRPTTLQSILKNMCELYKLLYTIPQFQKGFELHTNAPLLITTIRSILDDPEINELKLILESVLNPTIILSKNTMNKICFVMKQNINPYLDVSQQVFTETLEKIHTSAEEASTLGLILKTTQSGFSYIFKGTKQNIPEGCCRIVKLTDNKYSVNTPEMISLNNKFLSIKNDIIKLSIGMISEKSEELKKRITVLNKIAEMIGVLDMIICFVTYSSTNSTICKPKFNDTRSIIIKQGKHPILQTSITQFIPNDTYIDDTSRFCLINGPNMGGKSTYIRQIALLMILSHMGCFIPAKAASIRPLTNILSRLSTDDSIELNQSSFMKEMEEVKEIIELMNDSSLILIDELGRGTGIIDGVSISWAVSEEIILKSLSTCLFVSHFPELNNLERLYPHVVRQFHMEVALNDHGLCPKYKLTEGFDENDYYGIQIAEMAGFPLSIIQNAIEIKKNIQKDTTQQFNTAKYDLGQKLIALKDSQLDQSNLRAYLKYLKQMFLEE
ncbi:DNA mismatch repair protein mutS, putative [Entamoeba histolytica HM-1:IMSS-B]|uniref:DNA mismatch repair protein mutS, putative n=6 Tax=Entamoeba histolytica TaxID=5759 RepID=C4M7H8_ENTH1|nr:DNA mismatch repair protein mutS, putative [Entamoeba histolytica HM-1:IMSS]EMD49334.1 DNA mismatch repair protein mutS, putative [Entamoeba histolytica KU27]EMH72788.1 DNA mismatch repair protein mutS, putative [Entamoeba histolytica HM-1:IMSS-B]EMS15128.1 DNA mismatch repair protein mutS, putative [Entamoeba histolytica HM-3:IMSS]ENY62904.1 DNA mismatch repair protein mutS, putative [Entamoeba histolytica HM-1:IMSS-A]GAT97490.1 DNA mismatch repair protein muts putative [Entamoeba histolyt|eukprot:XP_652534.1 DNA mismatch repair protein mutS, putative [Entamoeba histolytica HM-1:IMSS]